MPELPEVETVRRGLAPAMEGQRIAEAQVRREGLRWPFPERLAERLAGRRVELLGRRSKYILAGLEGGETMILHLGMSGRMTISGQAPGSFHHERATPETHDHVILDMENGARVALNDARRFGALDLWPTEMIETHRLLAGLGPEPLGNGFDAAYLAGRLEGRKLPIKAALMDQKIVAGLGNIYVCEALHRARISPKRPSGGLSRAAVDRLVTAIRAVLVEAIEAGGSSISDHRQTSGELGYFQHTFRVYGREGEPCPTCGRQVQRLVQSGRSTFWCPGCQH
ncbi:bifunctional DNA-formamidopyrimidine glycosylase/DNA-(apurinic or apyrimidinic site) lyase [Pseudoroseicyclus tamaricis]|uniref:Formamidopyrimidine-DNA glycosylase n=1 Tax=Pseudoroseicyclus tamaricis TaxID=2705421 RepID=A0A6B2K0S5_9RHOB|nr:bifunctional DNA-formamidopyrimidine glycosylase/DNA-(apurinic or apyrimidinic site) lyase [Pseudoroseicyclus tamaricis]NDV02549.1 bifunctional DNA-formamidopyrimidine glycosylase/DNA-(apurinic or apyrimidinic site) lyase [Pseudoroseicyclus tamaricis]